MQSCTEVAFPLRAVAEHAQVVRVRNELLVEIENVAVRVTLAEDRHEAEHVGLVELGALRVGRDQALAGGLRGAVKGRLHRERIILRRGGVGSYQRLAVH